MYSPDNQECVCMYECMSVHTYVCMCTKSTAMSLYTYFISKKKMSLPHCKYDPHCHYATLAYEDTTILYFDAKATNCNLHFKCASQYTTYTN